MEGEKLLSTEKTSEEEEGLSLVKRVWEESKLMFIVAAPAIFTRFSTFGLQIISQAFVGHIGSTELAAFALVFTVFIRFANGILYVILFIFNYFKHDVIKKRLQLVNNGYHNIQNYVRNGQRVVDTLWTTYGAKEYGMMGAYLQRSWIVSFLVALLLPAFIFTSPILRILGQEQSIAQVAGTISLWSIPIMFAFIVSFTCQSFLESQRKNTIIAFLGAFSIISHVFFSWLLTIRFKFGIAGAMISLCLANWIPNIGQLIFVTCGWRFETWTGFLFLAFKDLWPVVKISLSAGAMLCLELWYNTVLVLLTGNLKNADALSICLNINGWEIMISFGFMAAASVRVANELGKGSVIAAKFSIAVMVLTSFTIGFLLFLFFLFFRERLAYIFTSNKDVAIAVGDLSPLLSVSILLNSVQPVLSGVAVGAGWQSIVTYVNLGCYYIIGIPVGIVLGNVFHWQVKGIWVGMLFGKLIQTIVLTILTYKTNWDEQVIIARNRINKWSKVDSTDQETETKYTSDH